MDSVDHALDHLISPVYRKILQTVVGCLYFTIAFTTSILFFIRARRDNELAKRSASLTLLGGLANAFASLDLLLQAGFLNQYPCFLTLWSAYIGILSIFMSYTARSIRLIFYWRLNMIKSREKGLLKSKMEEPTPSKITPARQISIDRNIWKGVTVFLLIDVAFTTYFQFSSRTVPGIPSIGVIPSISYTCPSYDPFWPFYALTFLFVLVISPISLVLIWRTRDNYGIRTDIICSSAFGIPALVLYFVWIQLPVNIRYTFPNLDWAWLGFLAMHTSSVMAPLIQSYRRQYSSRSEYDWTDFDHTMSDPSLFSAFARHSVEDFCAENTRFIEEYQTLRVMTVEAYRANKSDTHLPLTVSESSLDDDSKAPDLPKPMTFSHLSPTVTIADAIKATSDQCLRVPESLQPTFLSFYTLFILPGSVLEVNLRASTSKEITRQIESGSFKVTIFDKAMKEVLDLLFFDTFPKFYDKRKRLARTGKRLPWYRTLTLPLQREKDIPMTRFSRITSTSR